MNNLLEKANNNFSTGNWAEKQKFYDAAISRYYYCLYEKIIYIAKKQGFYTRPPSGEDSHNYTIQVFQENVEEKLAPADVTQLTMMRKLKLFRVKADYEISQTKDSNIYNLSFKYFFNSINEILDKLITQED